MINRLILLFLFVFSLIPSIVIADDKVVATLHSSEGMVQFLPAGEKEWSVASDNQEFRAGDVVKVGKHGRASIKFIDGTLVRVSKNAALTFEDDKAKEESFVVNLKQGLLHLFSRENKEHPGIKTPTMTATIHGTEFVVDANENITTTTVIAGAVEGKNSLGSVIAHGSESIVAKRGKAPVKNTVLDPYESAQWTFYYPSVLDVSDFVDIEEGATSEEKIAYQALLQGDYQKASSLRGNSWRSSLLRSIVFAKEGNNLKALEELEKANGSSVSYYLQKSSLQLAMGEIDDAQKSLGLASGLSSFLPASSQAKLQAAIAAENSVIALTINNSENAKALLEEAEEKDATSATLFLAKSYYNQAKFDLKAAYSNAEELLKIIPNSADANLRLAELALSFDNTKEAKQYIEKALEINPNNAMAYTMAGFVALQEREQDSAKDNFAKALSLNRDLPVAHLGAGLALIHDADLEGGRTEIEQAVQLSPNVALYRSYLGKTFFEEDKPNLANSEFERAIELDSDDPTPYLYRAFNNLSLNRVVEALDDVETSIAKNDNRAIYRSSLLLDRDEATRTANLSEIFTELGFEQAARVEAIKSINTDYTNFSAHRLLSDSYNTIMSLKSSLSEERISTLFAPLSFNVFHNSAAETSINEYSALFDKNEHRTGFNFSGSTYADNYLGELFQTGRVDKFGYLISGSSNAQHGSKSGNYLRDDRIRGAFQYEFNSDNRVMIDGAYKYIAERDFATTEYSSKDSYDGGEVTVGYHSRLNSNNHLLAQFSFVNDNDRYKSLDDRDFLFGYTSPLEMLDVLDDYAILKMRTHDDVRQLQGGLQHIYTSDLFTTIIGYEHLYSNIDRKEHSQLLEDELGIFDNLSEEMFSKGDYGLNSDTVYAYTVTHLTDWADVTFGLGYTSLDFEKDIVPTFVDDSFHNSKPNWKVGLTLYPTSDLTIRSAYFQGVASSAVENLRTLEPTLVGGINQFYSDQPGTEAENFGIGLDYKIPGSSYFGGEYVHRNLDSRVAMGTPYIEYDFALDNITRSIITESYSELRDQDIASAYFYQILTKQLVATSDYSYLREHLSVDESQELERHTVTFGLKYFATNNFFAYGKGAWRQQDRDNDFFFDKKVEDFWTLDLGLGYRIPNRHGVIKAELLNLTNEKFDLDQSLGFYEYIPEGIGGRVVASFNF